MLADGDQIEYRTVHVRAGHALPLCLAVQPVSKQDIASLVLCCGQHTPPVAPCGQLSLHSHAGAGYWMDQACDGKCRSTAVGRRAPVAKPWQPLERRQRPEPRLIRLLHTRQILLCHLQLPLDLLQGMDKRLCWSIGRCTVQTKQEGTRSLPPPQPPAEFAGSRRSWYCCCVPISAFPSKGTCGAVDSTARWKLEAGSAPAPRRSGPSPAPSPKR